MKSMIYFVIEFLLKWFLINQEIEKKEGERENKKGSCDTLLYYTDDNFDIVVQKLKRKFTSYNLITTTKQKQNGWLNFLRSGLVSRLLSYSSETMTT